MVMGLPLMSPPAATLKCSALTEVGLLLVLPVVEPHVAGRRRHPPAGGRRGGAPPGKVRPLRHLAGRTAREAGPGRGLVAVAGVIARLTRPSSRRCASASSQPVRSAWTIGPRISRP